MNVQASSHHHHHHHHLSCSTWKTPVVQANRPNINACPAAQRSSSPVHTDQVMVSQLGRGRSLFGLPDAAIEFSSVHRSDHDFADDDGDDDDQDHDYDYGYDYAYDDGDDDYDHDYGYDYADDDDDDDYDYDYV